MQHLTSTDYDVMPWKNGGGTTTELASSADQSGSMDGFVWRISIANVASNGPFSKFEGYDRIITMINGNGMLLGIEEANNIALDQPYIPHAFSGDWTIDGRLTDGPVTDFNLMVDRRKAKGSVIFCAAHEVVQNLDTGADITFLHNFSDHILKFNFCTLDPSDSLLIKEQAPLNIHLTSEDEGQMALVQIFLK